MSDEASAPTALAPAPDRALGSDPHDFAGLYIRHRSSFTSHARRYLRDPRDADEVVQEAFLRLFLALPELETELQALAYCRRTITNLCIDRYRADARRPRLVALDGPTVDELADDDTGDPVVRAEDAALVREALSQLPPLHRAALVKREIEEKPLPVIAGELDVAEDSVKHLLFRARRTLRKLLAGTSVAPGADAELARGLRPAARGVSGGVAGLLLVVLLGLGSGPDLRAVPVVGVDLPDVLGVTAVADTVGDAVRGAVRLVTPNGGADTVSSSSGPVSGSQPRPDADGSVARQTVTTPADRAAGAGPGTGRGSTAAGGAQPVVPVSGRSTAGVPAEDGMPGGSVVSLPGAPPGAKAPVTGGQPTDPTTSAGRGLPVAAPAGAVVPVAGQPVRPTDSGTAGRSSRADDAVQKAAGAAKSAARAEQPAGKAAERVPAAVPAQPSDKAADTAQRAVEQAAEKAGKAAEKADKAAGRVVPKASVDKPALQVARPAPAAVVPQAKQADAGDKAAAKADKTAEKAAAKADRTVEKVAAKLDKAEEKTSGSGPAESGASPATAVAPVPAP